MTRKNAEFHMNNFEDSNLWHVVNDNHNELVYVLCDETLSCLDWTHWIAWMPYFHDLWMYTWRIFYHFDDGRNERKRLR